MVDMPPKKIRPSTTKPISETCSGTQDLSPTNSCRSPTSGTKRKRTPSPEHRTTPPPLRSSKSLPSSTKRKKSFQIQGKLFLLTFPRCATTKSLAMERIVKSTSFTAQYALVAQEKHVDGFPHLHIIIYSKDRIRTRNPSFFDFIAEKHGDYKVTRDFETTYRYCTKEDATPLEHGIRPGTSSSASPTSVSTKVAEMVTSGSTLRDIATAHPSYFMLNKKKIEDFRSFVSTVSHQQSTVPLKLPIPYSGHCPATRSIVEWLNTNLFTTRPFKSQQLYLSAPPNSYKTTLVNTLTRYCRIYYMPAHEEFYDFYSDDDYDLIVLDEFCGNKKLTFLNAFIQGSPMNVPKKGAQYMKIKNLPVIFLSNFTLDECYKNADTGPLRIRLKEIPLTEPIDIEHIHWDGPPSTTSTGTPVSSPRDPPLPTTEGGSPILNGKAPIYDTDEDSEWEFEMK